MKFQKSWIIISLFILQMFFVINISSVGSNAPNTPTQAQPPPNFKVASEEENIKY